MRPSSNAASSKPTVNSTHSPPGSAIGQRCEYSPWAVSSVVSASSLPPWSASRMSPELWDGATTMVPSSAHVPPRGLPPTSTSGSTTLPSVEARDSLRFAKKPMARPSGEKNGCTASSVPGRRRSSVLSRLRTCSIVASPWRVCSTSVVPAGSMSKGLAQPSPRGLSGGSSRLNRSGLPGAAGDVRRAAIAASAVAAAMTAMAHGSTRRHSGGTAASAPPWVSLSASVSSRRASPMCCRRSAHVLAQAAAQQAVDGGRRRRRQCAPVGLVAQHRGQHLAHGAAAVDRPAREHLEEPGSRTTRRRCARPLPRRVSAPGSCRRAVPMTAPAAVIGSSATGLGVLGSGGGADFARPKSTSLARPPMRQHDVRRLEVAVNDALRMRLFEAARHLHGDRLRFAQAQRTAPQALGERSHRRHARG